MLGCRYVVWYEAWWGLHGQSNDKNWITFTSRYLGGGADCIMLRTFSTLDVKKAEKSCGENDDELGALLSPRTVSNVCQRRAGLVEFATCDRHQNRLLFCSTRRCEVLSACSHDSDKSCSHAHCHWRIDNVGWFFIHLMSKQRWS